jgi:hypothetical protein
MPSYGILSGQEGGSFPMKHMIAGVAAVVACSAMLVFAQTQVPPTVPTAAPAPAAQTPPRPASPRGSAEAQVGGQWVKGERGQSYQGGKWIDITFGRPLKRGRDLWGGDKGFGSTLNAGAPVWRAGADVSTRLKTEADLMFGDKKVPAGEYSMFVELKSPSEWTLIISSWGAKKTGRDDTPDTLWGAYNYTPAKDVARVPMTVAKSEASVEQLTWGFCDITDAAGKIFLAWDTANAMVSFTVAK